MPFLKTWSLLRAGVSQTLISGSIWVLRFKIEIGETLFFNFYYPLSESAFQDDDSLNLGFDNLAKKDSSWMKGDTIQSCHNPIVRTEPLMCGQIRDIQGNGNIMSRQEHCCVIISEITPLMGGILIVTHSTAPGWLGSLIRVTQTLIQWRQPSQERVRAGKSIRPEDFRTNIGALMTQGEWHHVWINPSSDSFYFPFQSVQNDTISTFSEGANLSFV